MTPERKPKEAPFPKSVRIMLVEDLQTVPNNIEKWIFEPKLDGARAETFLNKDTGEVRLQTRWGTNITQKFPEFKNTFAALLAKHSVVLDGEIIFYPGSSLSDRQKVVSRITHGPATNRVTREPVLEDFRYMVFDILYLDGQDLRNLPLLRRKQALEKLFRRISKEKISPIIFASNVDNASRVLDYVDASSAEGIVIKRKDSPYVAGRNHRAWWKIKPPQP